VRAKWTRRYRLYLTVARRRGDMGALELDRIDGTPMAREGAQVVTSDAIPDSNRMVLSTPEVSIGPENND
jgi:hypothetical protein